MFKTEFSHSVHSQREKKNQQANIKERKKKV